MVYSRMFDDFVNVMEGQQPKSRVGEQIMGNCAACASTPTSVLQSSTSDYLFARSRL